MPKCRNCEFCIGYDSISACYICAATSDIEYIETVWGEDNDLECDLYVEHDLSNNTTKKP